MKVLPGQLYKLTRPRTLWRSALSIPDETNAIVDLKVGRLALVLSSAVSVPSNGGGMTSDYACVIVDGFVGFIVTTYGLDSIVSHVKGSSSS